MCIRDSYGAVLLPDGRIFCIPQYSLVARIYDPVTNTLITPAGTYPGGSEIYSSGCLLPDGRVFCGVDGASVARIYDPATNTLTTPNGSYPGTVNAMAGALLLKDGSVFCTPGNTTVARIHKIYNNANFSLAALTGPYLNKY